MPRSTDIALAAEGVAKSYTIAHKSRRHDTLTDAITHAVTHFGARPQTETFWALQDVSFQIAQGEVVGIIGRNGAGKSTLLKILSRITQPTRGQIDVYGRVGSLLEVGTGFHADLTGRENIYLNGAILGMRKREIDRQFDAIVDFAGTEKFLDTPVKRYSSGMYVRLAFAVAAHLEPEILIVDEVLSVGDAEFQKKCLGKMQTVANHGRTILFVSHNMGPIRSLCHTVMWMNAGRLHQVGPTKEVIDAYLKDTLLSSDGLLELRDAPRASWISDAPPLRICRVEFNAGKPVYHGEALTVRIEYETIGPVYDVSLGFGFSNMDGTRMMSTDSDLMDGRRDLPANQRGALEATMETLYLQPGRYLLDIGARSGDYNGVDYLPGCAQVQVLPGPSTPSAIVRDDVGVRMPALWLWKSADGRAEALKK